MRHGELMAHALCIADTAEGQMERGGGQRQAATQAAAAVHPSRTGAYCLTRLVAVHCSFLCRLLSLACIARQLRPAACTMQAPTARQSAALCVAKVAALELPQQAWPELLPALLANMNSQDSGLKQATLATLGYVCEEVVALEEEIFAQEQAGVQLDAHCLALSHAQS